MNQKIAIERTSTMKPAQAAEISPFVIEFFMVEGLGFRCMAYRDNDGKWRDAFKHYELHGDIQILE